MKRVLSILIGFAAICSAQPQVVYTQPQYAVPQKFNGTTAPGNVPGNLPGDFYTNTAASPAAEYFCGAPRNTPPPACTSVAAGQWTLVGAGSGSGGGVSVLTATSGSGTAYTGTCSPAPASITNGTTLLFIPDIASTSTAATVACTGVGSASGVIISSTNSAPTSASFLQPNNSYYLTYNATATKWVLTPSAGPVGTFGPESAVHGTNYTVQSSDCNTTIAMNGTSLTLTVPLLTNCNFDVVNQSTSAMSYTMSGGATANGSGSPSFTLAGTATPSANGYSGHRWQSNAAGTGYDVWSANGATGPTGPANNPSPTAGTSVSLTSGISQFFVCTNTCTITVPAPAAGAQYCVYNDNNVSTVITLSAIGSSARYENTARTAYGTAGTGTFVSSGAVGDEVCIVYRDSTHYSTLGYRGTWSAN